MVCDDNGGLKIGLESVMKWSRCFFRVLGCSALLISLFQVQTVSAENVSRWVATGKWQGRGNMVSPLFFTNALEWRVWCRNSGPGSATVKVYDLEGNQVGQELSIKAPPGTWRRSYEGNGWHYFVVDSNNAEWEVKLLQHVTMVQHWDLKELYKKTVEGDRFRKLATWLGDGMNHDRYSLKAPKGSWKLSFGHNEGKFELRVIRARDNEVLFSKKSFEQEQAETWFHGIDKGEPLFLEVKSVDAKWYLEVIDDELDISEYKEMMDEQADHD
jgi:hypothetical protein